MKSFAWSTPALLLAGLMACGDIADIPDGGVDGGGDASADAVGPADANATDADDAGSCIVGSTFDGPCSWSTFDITAINADAKGFDGAAFDGRYVYFAPRITTSFDGLVARFDTKGSFGVSSSWSFFDVSTTNPNARGFEGAVFDGRYVYLVPHGNQTGLDGVIARFDTTAPFTSAASWSTFDVTSINAGAKGFDGATFDGQYLYFIPNNNSLAWDGIVVRLDTTASFTASASWSVFDVSTVNAGAGGFIGATFDGRYVYLVPFHSAVSTVYGDGLVVRFDTTKSFTAMASWSVFDVSTIDTRAVGFFGAAFDGRFVYLVPFNDTVAARFDTTASFTASASWSTFDVSTVNSALTRPGFAGAAFDGRFLYLVPYGGGGSGLVARVDTTSSFTASASWSTFDVSTIDAMARGFMGAVFDGEFVYFVPQYNAKPDSVVARFEARPSPSMPNLPGWNGSFF